MPVERGLATQARTGCRAIANRSTIAAQNAGRSAGDLLVVNCPSMHTSSSTTSAPALRRSVRTLGQEVIRLPRTTSASIIVHGAWQIAATGLPVAQNALTKATASVLIRSLSGFKAPPGSSRASKSSGLASETSRSTAKRSGRDYVRLPRLDLTRMDGQKFRLGANADEGSTRKLELHALDTIGSEDGDLLAQEFVCH